MRPLDARTANIGSRAGFFSAPLLIMLSLVIGLASSTARADPALESGWSCVWGDCNDGYGRSVNKAVDGFTLVYEGYFRNGVRQIWGTYYEMGERTLIYSGVFEDGKPRYLGVGSGSDEPVRFSFGYRDNGVLLSYLRVSRGGGFDHAARPAPEWSGSRCPVGDCENGFGVYLHTGNYLEIGFLGADGAKHWRALLGPNGKFKLGVPAHNAGAAHGDLGIGVTADRFVILSEKGFAVPPAGCLAGDCTNGLGVYSDGKTAIQFAQWTNGAPRGFVHMVGTSVSYLGLATGKDGAFCGMEYDADANVKAQYRCDAPAEIAALAGRPSTTPGSAGPEAAQAKATAYFDGEGSKIAPKMRVAVMPTTTRRTVSVGATPVEAGKKAMTDMLAQCPAGDVMVLQFNEARLGDTAAVDSRFCCHSDPMCYANDRLFINSDGNAVKSGRILSGKWGKSAQVFQPHFIYDGDGLYHAETKRRLFTVNGWVVSDVVEERRQGTREKTGRVIIYIRHRDVFCEGARFIVDSRYAVTSHGRWYTRNSPCDKNR